MKNHIFGVLQRIGRSFMLPIAILPVAGLLLGIGSSFTNETTIETYRLGFLLGDGTLLHALLMIMNRVGSAVFDNLPFVFAVGIAIGMAKKEKAVAALAAAIAYLVMNTSINAMLTINGEILENGTIAPEILEGTIVSTLGILSLQTGVFGGIIVGLGTALLHNRFYRVQFPSALSFFGGTRFVPILATLVYMFVGILLYFVWPPVQNVIYALGAVVAGSGYAGTFLFGIIKRALIPFGLHHVFYMPFWHTAVGGTMQIAGQYVQGGQNIFFAQLADAANVAHFSADAARYFSGEFIFMIFGLPGAALAMYHCARPEKKKAAGGLLLSAALTCILTGITEPLEFSFLFAAPLLFVVQVLLAGAAYMIAHMLNIAVGLTFSGGLLDFFLFGILQGNDKTSWIRVIPVGIIYFFVYYFVFRFLIQKFDFKTPGREQEDQQTRLYTRADREAYKTKMSGSQESKNVSAEIVAGLGGADNISDVDCCATRLRCSVQDPSLVSEEVLKRTGATGIIRKGTGVQIVYGPHVTGIKSDLEEYLEQTNQLADPGQADLQPDSKLDSEKEQKPVLTEIIYSPVTGIAESLDLVPDDAFSGRMMGDGAAVIPTDGIVRAPADGTVYFVFETKHALGFQTQQGTSILIHIGIDTVALNGSGFESFVSGGQRVKKGDPLLKIDLDYVKTHAPSLASPVICTELSGQQQIRLLIQGNVKAGEGLFVIETYE